MKKNTLILTGTLGVLLLLAWYVINRPGEQSVSSTNSSMLVSVDSLAVDKIEVSSPSNNIVLERKGIEWFLASPVAYRADQSSVTSLIHQAKNMIVKGTVSSNPVKRGMFQVDSTGTLVRISQQGKAAVSFVVGKMGQSYTETYARKEESNDVVIVEGFLSWIFNKAAKDWRDKTVLSLPRDNVKEISFQYPGETFALSLRDSIWMLGNAKAKAADVASLVSSVTTLQADDFVDSTLSPMPKIVATVSIGGVQIRFSESKDKEKYLIQTSNSPQWFSLQSWRVKQVLKHKKDLV